MAQEQLFASFLLDRNEELEIALPAEIVLEVTPIVGRIVVLPGSVDFLAGIMHLRSDAVPIVNLKKRLRLASTVYADDAKVAVVRLGGRLFGLLIDDILDVFKVEPAAIQPLHPAMMSEDRIVTGLIRLTHSGRTVDLLDLDKLFLEEMTAEMHQTPAPETAQTSTTGSGTRSRFVIFPNCDQEYGVPVEYAREITLPVSIDRMFQSNMLEGSLDLRGRIVPVMHAWQLLAGEKTGEPVMDENVRVLVLAAEECTLGLIVEEVREILTIANDEILPMPAGQAAGLTGVYARKNGKNIMLLDMPGLVGRHCEELKSMSRIGNGRTTETEQRSESLLSAHHLITENSYLVFYIGKNFAIEIKDVVEIIENRGMLAVPGTNGYRRGVINLRGQVVPVVSLRQFYGYAEPPATEEIGRLIICRGDHHLVALEVDNVVTIYKQEKYHTTPSLHPRLAAKRDTIDRLIEFSDGQNPAEHVLVVNGASLIRNHLHMDGPVDTVAVERQGI